jgi:hypothetical protein
MTKNTGNDRAMSYVRKISLVAGSISALALMSTVKAARAAGLTGAQNVSSGEITVDWDLDALEANDEDRIASGPETSEFCEVTANNSDTCIPLSTATTGLTTMELCEVTANNSDTCIPLSTTTTGSTTTYLTTTNGALPSDQVVATETFTFDVASTSSDLVALSVASTW